jgi:hypothetical protein
MWCCGGVTKAGEDARRPFLKKDKKLVSPVPYRQPDLPATTPPECDSGQEKVFFFFFSKKEGPPSALRRWRLCCMCQERAALQRRRSPRPARSRYPNTLRQSPAGDLHEGHGSTPQRRDRVLEPNPSRSAAGFSTSPVQRARLAPHPHLIGPAGRAIASFDPDPAKPGRAFQIWIHKDGLPRDAGLPELQTL